MREAPSKFIDPWKTMRAWKNAYGRGKSDLHRTVRYRIVEQGLGRRKMLLKEDRCQQCGGTGLDFESLDELSLDERFYHCLHCHGTGNVAGLQLRMEL